jgi:hypothetical protein
MRDGRHDRSGIRGSAQSGGGSGRLTPRRRPPDEPAELAQTW